jgi:hypothetical protein
VIPLLSQIAVSHFANSIIFCVATIAEQRKSSALNRSLFLTFGNSDRDRFAPGRMSLCTLNRRGEDTHL